METKDGSRRKVTKMKQLIMVTEDAEQQIMATKEKQLIVAISEKRRSRVWGRSVFVTCRSGRLSSILSPIYCRLARLGL